MTSVLLLYTVDIIFVNYKIVKHVRIDKYVASSNISIYYTLKKIKMSCKKD